MAQQTGEARGRGESAPEVEQVEELPVGLGLAWRLRALILSGRLPAGDRLPGVRDFAVAAGVNVNTALLLMAGQVIWVVIFYVALQRVWRVGIRQYSAVGA